MKGDSKYSNQIKIYDVAGAAKVSLATVSRVMNNPEKVNPETRERVLKVIQKLGYKPNAIARGLASRKTTTVGVIMADVSRAASAAQFRGHHGKVSDHPCRPSVPAGAGHCRAEYYHYSDIGSTGCG